MDEPVNISADRRPKVGLVLEGGGLRGIFTAGVLDILMDNSFRPDTICATSAGATFGINLPSGQRGRVLRYNLKLPGDPRYFSVCREVEAPIVPIFTPFQGTKNQGTIPGFFITYWYLVWIN